MHQQRRLAAQLCLTAVLCYGNLASTYASNCREFYSDEAVRIGGHVGSDGYVHYTIGYSSEVASAQIEAMQRAINLWNSRTATTRTVFDEIGYSGGGDFEFVGRSPGTGFCTGYVRQGSVIFYDMGQMGWAGSDLDAAAGLYAHELGHGIGLDHKGYGSIMYDGNALQTCEQKGQDIASAGVTQGDASDAHGCAYDDHQDVTYGPPPAYFWQDSYQSGGQTCTAVWYTTEYYHCDSEQGCGLDHDDTVLWALYC